MPPCHRLFGNALNSYKPHMTHPENYRPWNMKSLTASRKPFKRKSQKVIYCTLSLCLASFAQVSTVSTAASRSSSVFAQVSGGELKSTRLWRAAHGIYCPDPISKGSARGLTRWIDGGGGWSWEGWKKSWQKCQRVVWLVVHVGGRRGPNSWNTWHMAWLSSHPLLQFCLFISLSLALQMAELKLALNEHRDHLNEKKDNSKYYSSSDISVFVWLDLEWVSLFHFFQLTLDVSTKHLNSSGLNVSFFILVITKDKCVWCQWREDADTFFISSVSLF